MVATGSGVAQMHDNQDKTMTCDEHSRGRDRLARFCEVREQTVGAPRGPIEIDAGTNGGVTVKGWSRADVLIRARIETAAPSDAEARSTASQIQFASGSGHIQPQGPETDHDHNWSVSYEVFVPHQMDVDARAHNGGVHLQDLKGHVTVRTVNGGVHLARLAGDVSGQTVNGGVHVELMGDRWDGKGMDLQTTNGGVHIQAPGTYSAHFETSTENGSTHMDFPVMVKDKRTKAMSFDMGSGGTTIRAATTNGGVKISHI